MYILYRYVIYQISTRRMRQEEENARKQQQIPATELGTLGGVGSSRRSRGGAPAPSAADNLSTETPTVTVGKHDSMPDEPELPVQGKVQQYPRDDGAAGSSAQEEPEPPSYFPKKMDATMAAAAAAVATTLPIAVADNATATAAAQQHAGTAAAPGASAASGDIPAGPVTEALSASAALYTPPRPHTPPVCCSSCESWPPGRRDPETGARVDDLDADNDKPYRMRELNTEYPCERFPFGIKMLMGLGSYFVMPAYLASVSDVKNKHGYEKATAYAGCAALSTYWKRACLSQTIRRRADLCH